MRGNQPSFIPTIKTKNLEVEVASSEFICNSEPIRVKLLDFGLAKPYETSGASGFTQARQGGGTIPYMAPEQILNFRDVRPPADIYSAGATLYRLLSGEYPHDFPEEAEKLLVALEHPIVPLEVRAPWLPKELCSLVHKALSTEAEARFSSAKAMKDALVLVCMKRRGLISMEWTQTVVLFARFPKVDTCTDDRNDGRLIHRCSVSHRRCCAPLTVRTVVVVPE